MDKKTPVKKFELKSSASNLVRLPSMVDIVPMCSVRKEEN